MVLYGGSKVSSSLVQLLAAELGGMVSNGLGELKVTIYLVFVLDGGVD